MAHGGTNFGFYNGANTGADESDYKPDLTSYDYVSNIVLSICSTKLYFNVNYGCRLVHTNETPFVPGCTY